MKPKVLKISTMSPYAREWLSRPGHAQVLQVFKNSCNLVNVDRELLSMVTSDVGPGPFSAVLPYEIEGGRNNFSEWVEVGDEVQIIDGQMRFGKVLIVSANAELWNPKPDWRSIHAHRNWIIARVPELVRFLQEQASPDSLFQIMEGLVLENSSPILPMDVQGKFHSAAIRPARSLLKGIVDQRPDLWGRGLSGLLGLGGGLTPAGDDFILGIFFAIWLLFLPQPTNEIFLSLRQLANDRTNQLSAAYLRAAANGEATYPWHLLFNGIVTEDTSILFEAVHRILHHGETSGSDALTGFVSLLGKFTK